MSDKENNVVDETVEETTEEVVEETENIDEDKEKSAEQQINDLMEEVNAWKTDYYKVFADMENLKKRLQKSNG